MQNSYEKRLIRVMEYIRDNPAEVAAMSRVHWHRVFHAMTGETCAQATRRIRLHRGSCWLLESVRADVLAKQARNQP